MKAFHPPTQVGLLLDWSNMGKQHLNWLLPRIPQTKDLSLVRFSLKDSNEKTSNKVGLEYNMTVSALNTCNCPLLQVQTSFLFSSMARPSFKTLINQELNLSFVANLTDAAIHKLLSAPRDSRPGVRHKKVTSLKPYSTIRTSTVSYSNFFSTTKLAN